MNNEISENEKKIIAFEQHRTEVFKKAQSIVNRNFVDAFNHTFYCEVEKIMAEMNIIGYLKSKYGYENRNKVQHRL